MKLLITGDWHITDQQPRKRLDNYPQTVQRKYLHILELAYKNNCVTILQPGDLLDSHKVSDDLKQEIIATFNFCKNAENGIYTIFGQHDLKYHSSDRNDTPLKVLHEADAVTILNIKPILLEQSVAENVLIEKQPKRIYLYGSSWGEDIPKLNGKKGTHILVTHRMVIKNKKAWFGQEDYDMGLSLLRKSGFDYIVSGDNHQSFTVTDGKKILFNCGSMMRNRIDMADYKPCVWILDTDTEKTKQLFIPIEPFVDVFDTAKEEEEKKTNIELETYTENLVKTDKPKGLDYKENLRIKVKKNKTKIPASTRSVIDEVMGMVKS